MDNSLDFIKKLQHERTAYNFASQVRTLTNSLLQLSTGIYTEPERFVYELLQNAVDAFADTDSDTLEILIRVEDNKFIFLHNGNPFSAKDVEGICDVGNGTKANDNKKIGYKGIGFKSVFMPSVSRVSIKSGDFCFMFDKNEAVNIMPPFPEDPLKPQEVPWQVIPISREDLDEFNLNGFNVATIVETTEAQEIANKVNGLFSNLQFLLFLRCRNVNIRFERNGQQMFSVGKEREVSNILPSIYTVKLLRDGQEESSWLLYSKEVEVTPQVKEDISKDFNTPDKLKGAERMEISFAVQVVDGKLKPIENSTVFTFLPTSYSNLKEPFLLNANFITDAGRQQLHQGSEWNKFIFKKIPELYLEFVAKISRCYSNYAEVLPTRYPAHDALTDLYRSALVESFRNVAFVPNKAGSKLLKLGEVLIDTTGVTHSVIPATRIYEYINDYTHNTFSSDSLIDDNGLSDYAHDKVALIKQEDIIRILNAQRLFEGLEEEDNVKLIEFLYNYAHSLKESSKFQEELRHCPFLLDANGNWDCPLNLFLPSEFKEHNEQAEDVNFLNEQVLDGIKPDVLSWLKDDMGMKELDDRGFVKYLIGHSDFITTENAVSIGKYLFKLWQRFNFLDEDNCSKEIRDLPFLAQDGSLKPICNLYLGSKYKPEDDIEPIHPDKSLFISDEYSTESDEDDWAFFLKKCGIGYKISITEELVSSQDAEYDFLKESATTFRDKPHSKTGYYGFKNPIINIKFRLYYFSIIDPKKPDYELDKLILSRILSMPLEQNKEDRIKGVVYYWGTNVEDSLFDFVPYEIKSKYKSYLEYVMAEYQRFPTTMENCEAANDVFINSPSNLLLGGNYLPILNIDSIVHDSWRQKLPFKQALSTDDLLVVLDRISEDTEADKEEVRERVSAIYRELIERGLQNSHELADWAATHKLLSKSGTFLSPSELTYITVDGFKSGNKVYCEKVGKENHDNLLQLLRTFGVKVITKKDLNPTFDGEHECGDIKNRLTEKVQYLALLKSETKADYEQCLSILTEIIDSSIFFKCKEISLTYGNNDDVLQRQTFEVDGKFYCVGDFSATKIQPLLTPLCKFLGIKNRESELMAILLTNSHDDLVEFLADKGCDVSCLVNPHKHEPNMGTSSEAHINNAPDSQYQEGSEPAKEPDGARHSASPTAPNAESKEKFLQEYSDKVKEFMGGSFSLPEDKKIAEHIITRYRVLMFIKNRCDFELAPGFDEKQYIQTEGYSPIPLPNGKYIHVQGTKYGIWHLSPNVWKDVVEHGHYVCLCTGNGENDFRMIKSEDDIKEIAESHKNVFMRLTPTEQMDIMDTIKSIISPNNIILGNHLVIEQIYSNRDVHLMLMVHPTADDTLNSMFDGVFNTNTDNFDIGD